MMSLQAALVEHSSPTLAGLKPASLFRYQPEEGETLPGNFLPAAGSWRSGDWCSPC